MSTHTKTLAVREPVTAVTVHAGQILGPATPGARGRIRNTRYMHLPNRQATLDGPMDEVGQIIALLMNRGEIVAASTPAPSANGVMTTLHLAAVAVRPAATRGRQARRRWSTRRQVTVTASVITAVLATLGTAGYVMSTLPLSVDLVLIAIHLVLILFTRPGRQVCKTVVTVIHNH